MRNVKLNYGLFLQKWCNVMVNRQKVRHAACHAWNGNCGHILSLCEICPFRLWLNFPWRLASKIMPSIIIFLFVVTLKILMRENNAQINLIWHSTLFYFIFGFYIYFFKVVNSSPAGFVYTYRFISWVLFSLLVFSWEYHTFIAAMIAFWSKW